VLVLGPYETLVIVSVLVLLTFGPVLAGTVLAFLRRIWRRRGSEKDPR
jgi:hypothetical protein